jgi:hypothetical protein
VTAPPHPRTVLRDQGLLSEHAYAALVMLALLWTAPTGPMFRLTRGGRAATPATEPESAFKPRPIGRTVLNPTTRSTK